MKRYNLIKVFFVIQIFCVVCSAVQSPIGDPTVPPSSTQRGLRRSPSPIDNSGNLIVTGNVRGGMEFRGLVPYRSTTEFGADAGSADIGSFLRRSAPIDIGRRQASPQPYYLPSTTVSSMNRNGTSGLVSYPSVKQTKGSGEFALPEAPKVQDKITLPASSPLYEYNLSRPLSYKPADLERVVSYDLMRSKKQQDLIDALDKAAKDKQDALQPTEQIQQEDQSIFSGPEPIKPIERSFEPAEPLKPGQMREEVAKTKSIYEQMLEEIKEGETAAVEEEQAEEESRIGAITDANVGGMQSEFSKIEKETAEAIVGVHKTFAAQTEDKFNYYMKSAEEFLQQGQYYRAADAYTLASIYKPQDPLAHAGRAHALFASGEYMSSAYYLAAALNIFPEYVKFKIDLNAMIPDKDRLESRISDIKTWIDRTDSPELSFLLAYIYHQLGNDDLALGAINFSAQKLPDSEAVKVLKQAIENN
ncbi:MAG: hypothetical protein PHQ00_04515 [Phycisphaerae bacterium]|nr:hypothetical protein [Phycisphaerae bacterium]